MHENNARRIGNMVGEVHESLYNRRSVVGNRYLSVKVDILVDNPILVGYFQKKDIREDMWFQFKLERLPDFCYKYGLFVIKRCRFAEPTRVVVRNGISAKLYGPWLMVEYKEAFLVH